MVICLNDWMRFKRLLKFPGCHSCLNKRKAGNVPYLRILLIKSQFSGISHAQTPAMATQINLLVLDQVSRSSEHPLLRNSNLIFFAQKAGNLIFQISDFPERSGEAFQSLTCALLRTSHRLNVKVKPLL